MVETTGNAATSANQSQVAADKAAAALAATTPVPAFASAQGPDGMSVVYYIDAHGFIKRWEQQDENEDYHKNGRTEYNDVIVRTKDNKPIKSTSRDLGLAVLTRGDQYQTRLYYANEQNVLNEICLDLDPTNFTPKGKSAPDASVTDKRLKRTGVWYEGGLTVHNKFKCKPGTPVSAHFNARENAIKVYYFSGEDVAKDDNRPTVAWIQTGKGKDNSVWENLVGEI